MISLFDSSDMVPVSPGIPEGLCANSSVAKRRVKMVDTFFITANLITIYKF